MPEPAPPMVQWRLHPLPAQRWRRLTVRTIAVADVVTPEGRYTVRVMRVWWPRHDKLRDGLASGVGAVVDDSVLGLAAEGASEAFGFRARWGIRVFGDASRHRARPLVYGEDLVDPEGAVRRAHELVEILIA